MRWSRTRRNKVGSRKLLKQHYVQFDELFKTFAASGSHCGRQDLELSEFEDFCHQASLVATGSHATSVMVSCFQECNGDFLIRTGNLTRE